MYSLHHRPVRDGNNKKNSTLEAADMKQLRKFAGKPKWTECEVNTLEKN